MTTNQEQIEKQVQEPVRKRDDRPQLICICMLTVLLVLLLVAVLRQNPVTNNNCYNVTK
jgi:hypothetical protein